MDVDTLRVVAELGEGATARVVRARRPTGDDLAIKLARDESFLPVIVREARALALSGSPGTPRLVGVARLAIEGDRLVAKDDGLPALLESFRPGRGLASAGVLDPLRLAVGVGETLAALHESGVAHGDLKPGNVRVLEDGGFELVDLGLARPVGAREVEGATPAYLALGDADLGDARSRDALALGLMIACAAVPELERSDALVKATRDRALEGPVGEIVRALVSTPPSGRPSMRWVAARARAAGEDVAAAPSWGVELRRQRVRSAYARLREAALGGAVTFEGAPDELDELAVWGAALARLERRSPAAALAPLDATDRARWLVQLVGVSAASWPRGSLAQVSERALLAGLLRLAERGDPSGWTFDDVERAARSELDPGSAPPPSTRPPPSTSPETAAELAAELERVPVPADAIAEIELDVDSPPPLVFGAARALRLAGQEGRALALLTRLGDDPRALSAHAELARRGGDAEAARDLALRVTASGANAGTASDAAARACLARLDVDAGRPRAALTHLTGRESGATLEVEALAHHALGALDRALGALDAAESLPLDAEARARIAGARGWVLSGSDPAAAFAAYARAAEHALRAGAIVEEATYLTGLASSAVDQGSLEVGSAHATRAALLWEHVGRPSRAARAWLAVAAAHSVAGRREEAGHFAELARDFARTADDTRAECFARCAAADVARAGGPEGRLHAREAVRLAGTNESDELLAAARALRHGGLDAAALGRLDARAADARTDPGARLDWWGARAEQVAMRATSPPVEGAAMRADVVLAQLVGLAGAKAPLGARGPAFEAGVRLASLEGHGDAALRLRAAARDAAAELVRRAGPIFEAAVRDLPWVVSAGLGESTEGAHDSALLRELERQVRALEGTERLGELLARVLDALVMWTGVERGLLLLLAPDGRLVPRAARNLAKRDLTGSQLELSQSIARRALAALEPVVAVDAAGELPQMSESVHALHLRSVLAVPLVARGEALGVVYLDDRVRAGAFGEAELAWVRTLAQLAAVLVSNALGTARLTRAHRRAVRAERALDLALADRTAALDAARSELSRLTPAKREGPFSAIVGVSDEIRETVRTCERVAASDVPVLVTGESGTGKELFARAIHGASKRSREPFVSENCGAIPEPLLESALFGHVRGAFTGADRSRVGLFEAADRGTLFLDEVGEMSLPMQSKLLRVIEDGMVRPVGTERSKRVDVRVIAATHRDLSRMVADRTFREDLFYRLAVITVRVPPLRERALDVPGLVETFLLRHAAGRAIRVSPAAMGRLVGFAWPGNVRQLENEIRRALVLADDAIEVEHLSAPLAAGPSHDAAALGLDLKARVDELSTRLVREALAECGGNQTRAAKLLGLSRFGLQKMLKRLGLTQR